MDAGGEEGRWRRRRGPADLTLQKVEKNFFFFSRWMSFQLSAQSPSLSPPPRLFSVSSSATQTHTLSRAVCIACFLNSVLAFARLNARRNPPRASKTLERLWRKKKGGIKRDTVRSSQLRGGAIIRRGKKGEMNEKLFRSPCM